jgi:hypothetical protein
MTKKSKRKHDTHKVMEEVLLQLCARWSCGGWVEEQERGRCELGDVVYFADHVVFEPFGKLGLPFSGFTAGSKLQNIAFPLDQRICHISRWEEDEGGPLQEETTAAKRQPYISVEGLGGPSPLCLLLGCIELEVFK